MKLKFGIFPAGGSSRQVLLFCSLVLLATQAVAPKTAQADRIDGHWCYKDGRSYSIQGPKIVTPGGTTLRGSYDRHGFAYVVPKGEKGAGDKLMMIQQDDSTVHLWRNKENATKSVAHEVWRRCERKVS